MGTSIIQLQKAAQLGGNDLLLTHQDGITKQIPSSVTAKAISVTETSSSGFIRRPSVFVISAASSITFTLQNAVGLKIQNNAYTDSLADAEGFDVHVWNRSSVSHSIAYGSSSWTIAAGQEMRFLWNGSAWILASARIKDLDADGSGYFTGDVMSGGSRTNPTHRLSGKLDKTKAGVSAGINLLDTSTTAIADDEYLVSTESASDTTQKRKKFSVLWNWIKSKFAASASFTATEKTNIRSAIGAGTYSKPANGIPKTDFASAVQTSLGKADTAIQSHQDISGKLDKTKAGVSAGINLLDTSTTAIADDEYLVSTESASDTTQKRKKFSVLWNWIKSKFATSSNFTDAEKSSIRSAIGAGASSFSGSYNDLSNKPTIPTVPSSLKNPNAITVQLNGGTTEGTNKFTYDGSVIKTINITPSSIGAGTYSKPSNGIPKTDLASAVQTSLGKADTALQSHQDISGKLDKTANAASATKLQTKRYFGGIGFDGQANVNWFATATCNNTASNNVYKITAKLVFDIDSFGTAGLMIMVKFSSAPTGKCDKGSGNTVLTTSGNKHYEMGLVKSDGTTVVLSQKIVKVGGEPVGENFAKQNDVHWFMYDGEYWNDMTADVIYRGSNPTNGYYVKHRDGLIEQWNETGTRNKTITLPIPYSNTNYSILGVGFTIDGIASQFLVSGNKTTTSFGTASNVRVSTTESWQTKGY